MCGEKWVVEACPQWHYKSILKIEGGRATTPETVSLDADSLIPWISEWPIYIFINEM